MSAARAQEAKDSPGQKRDLAHQGLTRSSTVTEAEKPPGNVLIGKFEILAAYTYARAVRDGLSDREAKERGIVAAVMGSRARGGNRGGPRVSKEAAERKPRKLTAENYDQQVAQKLGPFYNACFMPVMKQLVGVRLSYARVKDLLEIPPAVGAKITSAEFEARTAALLNAAGSQEGSKPAVSPGK
jgi:hypothetical protein